MTVALNPDLKTVASGFCKSEQCHIQAETVAQKYNIRRIFLATDDPDVVYEASRRKEFRYMWIRADRSLFQSHMYIEHRIHLGIVDRKGVSDLTFLDLFLLRDCAVFVGTFSSHFSKAALELSVGQKGYFPPYASLDDPWSPLRPIVSSIRCNGLQCLGNTRSADIPKT